MFRRLALRPTAAAFSGLTLTFAAARRRACSIEESSAEPAASAAANAAASPAAPHIPLARVDAWRRPGRLRLAWLERRICPNLGQRSSAPVLRRMLGRDSRQAARANELTNRRAARTADAIAPVGRLPPGSAPATVPTVLWLLASGIATSGSSLPVSLRPRVSSLTTGEPPEL